MKALSIHPYYAIGIVTGDKTIVRTWSTDYRGDILICSFYNSVNQVDNRQIRNRLEQSR